jgi:hypothetical protein
MQFFKMTYLELLETYSSLVLGVLIFTPFCIDLVIDDNHKKLVAIATGPIAEYICYAHNTDMLSAADSIFHGYIRPSSTDPQDPSWIPALAFFCRGVTVARPILTKTVMIFILKKAQKYASYTTDRQTCPWGMSQSRRTHVANV